MHKRTNYNISESSVPALPWFQRPYETRRKRGREREGRREGPLASAVENLTSMSTTSFPWLYFLSNRFGIVCLHFSFARGATKCIDEMTAFVTPINTPVKKVLVADGLKNR